MPEFAFKIYLDLLFKHKIFLDDDRKKLRIEDLFIKKFRQIFDFMNFKLLERQFMSSFQILVNIMDFESVSAFSKNFNAYLFLNYENLTPFQFLDEIKRCEVQQQPFKLEDITPVLKTNLPSRIFEAYDPKNMPSSRKIEPYQV